MAGKKVGRVTGFEPATSSTTNWRSNQLSYTRQKKLVKTIFMVLICKTENRVNAFSLFFLKLFWLFPCLFFGSRLSVIRWPENVWLHGFQRVLSISK
jgi:hypothetical protein